jgi:hypothetical protein
LTLAGLEATEAIPLLAPLLNLTLPPAFPASSLPADQQRRRLLDPAGGKVRLNALTSGWEQQQ